MNERTSGAIAVTVIAQGDGEYVCEVTPALAGAAGTTKRFHGQTATHAIANALEDLARAFRMEAEDGQRVGWESVDQSPSGTVSNKSFHVILHYERLVEVESKWEAMHNTLLGNTVIENAEITIIQVAQGFPKLAWRTRAEETRRP